ncbi:hypothetical protein GXW78_09865 [Roseomonas terrae]|uniref:General stress protein 17M-like domain-containing protein n=1 Tax=Neoroseomonas terrae TaxID=424799 RepID=A0ABS5EG16_9PROT|nr:hypothetical protein [Neoroseomonas terrae]MBR0649969.1 hypothetical protein [Neoroseomonas terrae]
MPMQTRTWLFDTHAAATAAVRDLEAAGFTANEVSIVAKRPESVGTTEVVDDGTSGAGVGASVGGVIGGGAGLLAGIGVMAIPGIGPLVAAGWLATALAGAAAGGATGGIIGSLTGSGVDEREAHVYAEGVSRGGTIVTVRAEAARIARAADILASHAPVNTVTRESDYRAAGWSGYVDREMAVSGSPPDGAPGNPPGTMASRAVDDIAGTNISGARPENELPRRR